MNTDKIAIVISIFLCLGLACSLKGQDQYLDYQTSPREYTLAGIMVDGVVHLDHEMIIQKSGLVRGEKVVIPGDKISLAITELWGQGLFSSVDIIKDKTQGNNLFLRGTSGTVQLYASLLVAPHI